MTVDQLLNIAMANPINAEITARLPSLGLDQCMLTAGCLFQAVWNHHSNLSPEWGVKDYDVFYFDTDLSWEAENEVINRARSLFQDLDVDIEFKNQARVHLWYGQRFGRSYPQLRSAKNGIDRYLVAGTCIGLDVQTREVYAPYGLDDLERGVLRINPANPEPDLFIQKARSYQARWPWLKILDGDGNGDALPALTAREVGQVLREVVFERRKMSRVDSTILEQAHTNRAVVAVDGWLVTLHSDGEVLEYCETCVSPDGRRWALDSGNRYGTDPVALLSTWEHQSLGALLRALQDPVHAK